MHQAPTEVFICAKLIKNYLEDKRNMPIFALKNNGRVPFIGIGVPRLEELSGSWQLFFMSDGMDKF